VIDPSFGRAYLKISWFQSGDMSGAVKISIISETNWAQGFISDLLLVI
jgi:hypothetical protein